VLVFLSAPGSLMKWWGTKRADAWVGFAFRACGEHSFVYTLRSFASSRHQV